MTLDLSPLRQQVNWDASLSNRDAKQPQRMPETQTARFPAILGSVKLTRSQRREEEYEQEGMKGADEHLGSIS